MLPYSRGIILDSSNNYGIVKTETVLSFGPGNQANESFNTSEPMGWIFTHGDFHKRSLQEAPPPFATELAITRSSEKFIPKTTKKQTKQLKKQKRKSKGVKKCIFKILKKGDNKNSKKNRRGSKLKMHKKYLMPIILGLLAAKSLLIPVALKALAFISAKGLMMGFFSTVMASVLSLKGWFDHSSHYQNRKDSDTKTQVEIIQVPSKSEDQHVYYDDHYRRGDIEAVPDHLVPVISPFYYDRSLA